MGSSVLRLAWLVWLVTLLPAVPSGARELVAAQGADGVQRAQLVLDRYAFRREHLVVQAGRPVELTLVNVATLVAHNFVLDDPVSASRSARMWRRARRPSSASPLRSAVALRSTVTRSSCSCPATGRGMEGRLKVR